jgi:hypothetical protein
LDVFWLRDESLEDSNILPEPHVLAAEIADDLRSAVAQIEDVLADLQERVPAARRQRVVTAARLPDRLTGLTVAI